MLLLTLVLNLAVAVAKISYGSIANVLSIRADGFHSLTDSANNLVGLVSVWLSSRPPDRGHPYGHQKLEILAAGLVGVSLLAMAFDVLKGAILRLGGNASMPEVTGLAFFVLGGTLCVNVLVAVYEKKRGEELNSTFLVSDALHTRSDVLVTAGVLGATLLVKWGHPELDLYAALGVAGFIAWAGINVLRTNLGYLADRAQLEVDAIRAVVLEVPGVAGTHKIRTRGTPGAIYVDLHIQIAPHLNVVDAHRVTHWVIDAIKRAEPGVLDVLVHTEPANPGEPYKPLPDDLETGADATLPVEKP